MTEELDVILYSLITVESVINKHDVLDTMDSEAMMAFNNYLTATANLKKHLRPASIDADEISKRLKKR